ncbi:MAG: glycoside hydrolase family 3 C-terminal domain-containing protein [Bacteroidales bacterium]|nr:glycoside hydrolase family 3 C-terminal domain-containing protein [Bacteroidales bacterium]
MPVSAGQQELAPADMPFMNPSLPVAARVEDLLSRLTAEEKVGLMMNNSSAVPRLGIPAYEWWNEALHGVARSGMATVFPQAIGLAAAFDTEAQYKTFSIVSDEARAKYNEALRQDNRRRYYGITFWTPNINIFRDPRWGRGMETYGEDPYLSSQLGVMTVKGLQGDDAKYFKTHACAKHFAVHSGPEWNRHSYDAYVSDRDLWETYLPVFESLVKKGNVQEVMCAYNRFEGEPCCGSDRLLIRILREKWNYQGLVVSDCGAINDFYQQGHHETHANAEEASVDAVLTGTDIECGSAYRALLQGLADGKITESQLDVSVRRLLKGRFELGMFDPADRVPWNSLPYSIVGSAPHAAHALEMARKSMTLLKNSKGVLPLDASRIKTLAVVGPNATDSTMMWGNYNGTSKSTVTILQGIQRRLPDAQIIYERGCEWVGDISPDALASLSHRVASADAIVYVGGLTPRLEGEEMRVNAEGFRGGDRDSIDLPTVQKQVLAMLHATGKPVIFVLCAGSAIALGDVEQYYDALLDAWYPGQAGGTAVAEVLMGDYNPAGRLPVTFYASQNQLPDFEDYNMEGRTYRYFRSKPLYAFGFGLSYTAFKYSKARPSQKRIQAGETVDITFRVKNTGGRAGDEVSQVYVQRLNDADAPIKALKGFARTHIGSGETATLTLTLEADAFAYYDNASGDMAVKPGDYRILYGSSSRDEDLKALSLRVE